MLSTSGPAHATACCVGKAEAAEQIRGPEAGGARRQPAKPADHAQVLSRSLQVIDRGRRTGEADPPTHLAPLGDDVEPGHPGPAGVGTGEGGEDAEQGGLASAVGPEQGPDPTPGDLEVDPAQGARGPVCLGDPDHVDGQLLGQLLAPLGHGGACHLPAQPLDASGPISGPPFGPNNVMWLETALRALAATSLTEEEKASTVLLVSFFVRSETSLTADIAAARPGGERPAFSYGDLLARLTDPLRFPAIHRAIAGHAFDDGGDPDAYFNYGPGRILDGVGRMASPARDQSRLRTGAAIRPSQATAFLMSSPIAASVAASSEVMFHTTGCMLAPSSRAGFRASPKPNAMKSLPVLM